MKYAVAAAWILVAWLARRVQVVPPRAVEKLEDQASLRMFACAGDFEPAEVVAASKPTGYRCAHMTMTPPPVAVTPRCYAGCHMTAFT